MWKRAAEKGALASKGGRWCQEQWAPAGEARNAGVAQEFAQHGGEPGTQHGPQSSPPRPQRPLLLLGGREGAPSAWCAPAAGLRGTWPCQRALVAAAGGPAARQGCSDAAMVPLRTLLQVSLKLQKRLASSVLGCGLRKVWLDPNEVNDISMANSRECGGPAARGYSRAAASGPSSHPGRPAGPRRGQRVQSAGAGPSMWRMQVAGSGARRPGGGRRRRCTYQAAAADWSQTCGAAGGLGLWRPSFGGSGMPSQAAVGQQQLVQARPALTRLHPACARSSLPLYAFVCCRAEHPEAGEGRLHHSQADRDPLPPPRAGRSRGQGQGPSHWLR